MRRLAIVEFVTLDGVMQGFHANDADREAGFEHGGWGPPYVDEVQTTSAVEALPATTAYLFGRRTYEQMTRFWPHQPDDNPMAVHLNRTPKYVATTTLRELTWTNARVLHGDLSTAVRELKAEGEGKVTVLGSGALVEQLFAADLVDELELFVHPLLLGTGSRLFRGVPRPKRLRLTGCAPTSTGVVVLSYAGE